MVKRYEKMRKAVLIDLDGTLLAVNSFSQYVMFALKQALKSFRFDLATIICYQVAKRKLRFITHSQVKYALLKSLDTFMTTNRLNQLVKILIRSVNKQLSDQCTDYKSNGYSLVMATAAPECYARIISEKLGFDCCIATPSPRDTHDTWKELSGEEKCRAVKLALSADGLMPAVVFTDHIDDVPLMKIAMEKVFLVNPSEETIRYISLKEPNFSFEIFP